MIPEYKLRMVGDQYLGWRRPQAEKRGNLFLPDQAKERYTDCHVLQCGPGWGKGMHAGEGDRILCEPQDFETYEGDVGFVSDRALIGVIRAPDFSQLEPANDYLLLEPDVLEWEKVTAGGIIISQDSFVSGADRLKQRAYELYLELKALLASRAYKEQPTAFDKWCMERDFWSDKSPEERNAFCELRDNRRTKAEDNLASAPMLVRKRLCSGTVWGIGPDVAAQVSVAPGERVCFGFFDRIIRLTANGKLLVLVKAEALDCVVPEGAEFELPLPDKMPQWWNQPAEAA